MSSSEHDMSDLSNLESPSSHGSQFSPYSSPSQILPHLANGITEMSCDDVKRDNKPYLKIIEQPMNHFRFRYKSEMMGTHGCLLGKNSVFGKVKTHPTVELCNYNAGAVIRCTLARHDKNLDHPHKLTEEDEDIDVKSTVPMRGSYRVAFNGVCIIHSAKKDIATLLYEKYTQNLEPCEFDEHKLRMRCETETKNINLNIVRLKFSAHDLKTDVEICPPIYSDPIHNMKSAATNDPKICRASKRYGKAAGGDQVFILVEKVSKKNISVRFFELNENGERVWEAKARFLPIDVHHQYAIVFTTPKYDREISKDVKVYYELLRPSDGRTSEPKEFIYRADFSREGKKRKAESSLSSIGSSGGSLNSFSDLPLTVGFMNNPDKSVDWRYSKEMKINDIPILPNNNYIPPTPPSGTDLMGDALLYNISQPEGPYVNPLLSQPNVPAPPDLKLDSAEINRLLEHNSNIPSEERKRFMELDLSDYFRSFEEHLSQPGDNMMSFVRSNLLVADSGRPVLKTTLNESKMKDAPTNKSNHEIRNKTNYSAVYSTEDGLEVKSVNHISLV